MLKKTSVRLGAAALIVLLAGCSAMPRSNLSRAQYWQRSDATSSIYLQGPKAQQMLQRDISRCVTDVREMDRLGVMKGGVLPADRYASGEVVNPVSPEGAIELYQTPKRDRYMRSEYYDYEDFETCMLAKGWERTQYLPYDQAERSRKEYVETIIGQQYGSRTGENKPKKTAEPQPKDPSFTGLNQ